MKKNHLLAALYFLVSTVYISAQGETIVWSNDFEGDWTQNWFAESGTWEVGLPASGPDTVHGGEQCAATVLAGNYNAFVDSRLVKIASFSVPAASENPRLRFWHWFNFANADNDWGKVQIRVSGSPDWIDVSGNYNDNSTVWTLAGIDLADYAGQTVQIAFYFHSDNYYEGPGWFIDDVSLVTGPYSFNNPEGWEDGIGDWYAESGTWEMGIPNSGPDTAHTGQNCIATKLNANYNGFVDSRFVSPPLTLPAGSENPRLRFWHWFNFANADNDWGKVQIRVSGSPDWIDLTGHYNDNSTIWTLAGIDLADYAGQTVQIAFYFHSDNYYEGPGWFIDDISLETGPYSFNNPEGWEDGIGDWYAESGTWEMGIPNSGPDTAHTGQNCIATKLNANYNGFVDSRFVSPPLTLPAGSENPRLRFWHWFNFANADNDWGKVQIRVSGSPDWIDVSGNYNDNSTVWTLAGIDLADYAGQTVQIAFYFHSDNYYEGPGWFIDDVSLVTGPYSFNNPEGWEDGIGDWYAESGTWEMGIPNSGPDTAHTGQNCIATKLNANYNGFVDSRFVSPPLTLPAGSENPRLRFWHWFNFANADDDWGKVQIRVAGSPDWIDVTGYYNDNSTVWTYMFVDLTLYAEQTVQIAFYFHSDNYYEGPGWFIDDIIIEDNSDLTVDAGPDVTVTSGSPATLNATVSGGTTPYKFEWVPADGLSDPSILNPVASPSDTTTYTLRVTDDHECFRTDKVTVFVDAAYNRSTDIISFGVGIPPQTGDAVIDQNAHTIDIEVEAQTDVTKLIATFTLPEGATASVDGVNQQSGVTVNNFTDPVSYVVTADDGETQQEWVVTVQLVTGIDENSIQKMSIYPNPITGRAIINFSNPDHSCYRLSIYNLTGRKVLEIDNITSDKIELRGDMLSTGSYIIKLTGEKVFVNKVIVME